MMMRDDRFFSLTPLSFAYLGAFGGGEMSIYYDMSSCTIVGKKHVVWVNVNPCNLTLVW